MESSWSYFRTILGCLRAPEPAKTIPMLLLVESLAEDLAQGAAWGGYWAMLGSSWGCLWSHLGAILGCLGAPEPTKTLLGQLPGETLAKDLAEGVAQEGYRAMSSHLGVILELSWSNFRLFWRTRTYKKSSQGAPQPGKKPCPGSCPDRLLGNVGVTLGSSWSCLGAIGGT